MKFEILDSIKRKLLSLPNISVFTVIVFSDDTILFGTNADLNYIAFKLLVYFIVAIALLLNLKYNITRLTSLIVLCAIIYSIGFTALLNLDLSAGQFYQIFIILLSFLIVQYIDFGRFIGIFKKYIYFLSVTSICIFVIAKNNISILSNFPIETNSAGLNFINLYFGAVYMDVAEIRNASIFREPGVFMVYILLAIIFELFLATKINLKLIFCAFTALIMTFSTGGLILIFIIVAYAIKSNSANFSWKLNFAIIFFLSTVSFLIFAVELQSDVFSKLNSDSVAFGSTIARVASVVVNYEIFSANPIFGSGLANYGSLFESYSLIYFGFPLDASSQSSNTLMAIFATYGFLVGVIVVYGLMRLAAKLTNRFILQSILFLSIGLIFSSQDMRYSPLFFIMVFYGLKASPISSPPLRKVNTGVLIGK